MCTANGVESRGQRLPTDGHYSASDAKGMTMTGTKTRTKHDALCPFQTHPPQTCQECDWIEYIRGRGK